MMKTYDVFPYIDPDTAERYCEIAFHCSDELYLKSTMSYIRRRSHIIFSKAYLQNTHYDVLFLLVGTLSGLTSPCEYFNGKAIRHAFSIPTGMMEDEECAAISLCWNCIPDLQYINGGYYIVHVVSKQFKKENQLDYALTT